jgi:CheY-like chemotaxis protein
MKKQMEVCLIEDDMIQVFLTKKFLEKIGSVEKVVDFQNGKAAYDALKRRSDADEPLPDLILLDLNMPVWDGWEFYDAFMKLPESGSVTVYILTSSLDHSDMSKAEGLGLRDRYLSKPLTLPRLKEIIGD